MLAVATAAVALGCVTEKASAIPTLLGGISFNDASYTTDIGTLSDPGFLGVEGAPASVVESITGAVVAPGATGNYVGNNGVSVDFNTPIIFNPPTADLPLWTFVNGGDTFVFSASEMNAATYTYGMGSPAAISEINLSGSGFVEEFVTGSPVDVLGAGSGTWTMQLSDNDASLSFQAGSTTTGSLPDGGTTMMMLGGAFCAMGALRRKLGGK